MSSHRRATKYFSRKFNARKALIRGLMISLVEHGRIKTTVDKAKELRRHIEKAITSGKKDNLATRRLLLSRLPNEQAVDAIMTDLSKRFATRPGGYTRIIKIGRRPGDTAEMAFIEFVDYDWQQSSDAPEAKKAGSKKAAVEAAKKPVKAKAKAKVSKKVKTLVASKRKAVKKIQKKSRQEARA